MSTRIVLAIASAIVTIATSQVALAQEDSNPVDDAIVEAFRGRHGGGQPTIGVGAGLPGSGGGGTSSGGGGGGASGAAPASGGGDARDFECSSESIGFAADVAAVYAEVNAGATPNPADPNVVDNAILGSIGGVTTRPWFRNQGSTPQLQYRFTCPATGQTYDQWLDVVAQGGTFVPQPQPEDLLPELYERVVQELPTPVPRIAPADWMPEQWTYVHLPTFFWVDQGQGQWDPVTATASVPGLSVTATATPERLIVHPGDGSGDVTCEGAPPAFVQGRDDPETFAGCQHAYRNSSATVGGDAFPVTVDVVWHATWSASNGESGDLGLVSTTSETRPLPVAEVQALVTDG